METTQQGTQNAIENNCFLCDVGAVLSLVGIVLILLKKYFNGTANKAKRDLTGQVIIITGANTGIGLETAKEIAKAGATVVLACRDEKRGKEAANIVNEVRAGSAQFLKLDLSDLSSVRLFVNEFKSKYNRLDILVNNAGVMHIATKQLTKDGFEMQIGTNHFGHFLLTNLLLDILKKSPNFRVINVSSLAHTFGPIDLDDLFFEKKAYDRFQAYTYSKIANILFTQALQRRFDDEKIDGKTVSLHPGCVRTELTRTYTGILGAIFKLGSPIFYLFTKDALQGAQTTLHCVFKDFNDLEKGKYFSDCAVKPTNNKSITPEAAEKLWNISTKLVKL